MRNECYFLEDIYSGLVFIAKGRTDSGDNYMLSSPLRRKDPENPSFPKEHKHSDPTLQGIYFHILIHFIFCFNH